MSDRTSSGAKTLPRRFYASPTVFQEEIDKIFSRRWLFIGHESELPAPGSFLRTRVADEQIVIVRDRQRQVRAFYNVCRHRGAQFCVEERGELASGFQCPYHAWTYGLDGSLIGAPNMDEVEGFRRGGSSSSSGCDAGLGGSDLCQSGRSHPEPFDEAFAPLLGKFDQWHLAELTRAHRTVYDVRANWKLLFQNYSECYHCPTVHPMLNKLTPYRNTPPTTSTKGPSSVDR